MPSTNYFGINPSFTLKYDTGWMIGEDPGYSLVGPYKFNWVYNGANIYSNQTFLLTCNGFDLDLTSIAGFPSSAVDALISIQLKFNGNKVLNNTNLSSGSIIELSNGIQPVGYNSSAPCGTQIYFKSNKYYLRVVADDTILPSTLAIQTMSDETNLGVPWLRGDLRVIMKLV